MSKPDWTALADRYGALAAEYNAQQDDAIAEAFEDAWAEVCTVQLAHGECLPAVDLLALARANQDAGAAQDGQATVRLALALGSWLALVSACGLIVAATFGAAWATDIWTLGLALRGGQ